MKDFSIHPGVRMAALTVAALAWAGCGGSGPGDTSSDGQQGMPPAAQPMPEQAQALVNQGNEAQRAGSFQEAMGYYEEAMALAPDHPVPQFGALMAAMAMGDEALTDSLSAILQETSPELLTMLNPDGSMGGGMPANPHAQGMPGGMPGGMPPVPEGMTPMEGLPDGHPALYEVEAADTTAPDTTGIR